MMDTALPAPAEPASVAIIGENEAAWRPERQLLEDRGYACRWLPMTAAHRRDPERDALDLLILDGDVAGVGRVLAQVKALGAPPAVLVVSGSTDEADVEAALARGADDYLSRPVSGPLLLARVKAAMLGRRGSGAAAAARRVGPYELDVARRTAALDGRAVALTAREFDLARLLFDNLGRPLARGYLLEAIWGYRADVPTRTLDTHASRVRSKLALSGAHGVRLSSLYGYGYQLDLCPA